MKTYKPQLPKGFKSEKEIYEFYIKGRKNEIFKFLKGEFVHDYLFLRRLNENSGK